jgi:hypothetical protein
MGSQGRKNVAFFSKVSFNFNIFNKAGIYKWSNEIWVDQTCRISGKQTKKNNEGFQQGKDGKYDGGKQWKMKLKGKCRTANQWNERLAIW